MNGVVTTTAETTEVPFHVVAPLASEQHMVYLEIGR
jgi:hypothetical protein